MPEKRSWEPQRQSQGAPTTPEGYLTNGSSTFPSRDYSYTVELVATIQHTLGQLTEAVDALKEQTREHGKELKSIGHDIHTTKTIEKIVGVILAAVFAFFGWAINKINKGY